MRFVSLLLITGCWTSAEPVTPPPPSPPPSPPVRATLPCGVAGVDELFAFTDHVGTCPVNEVGPFREVMEHGRLVLHHGEAKPAISFDARIPGPHGIRVGMTAREVRKRLPGYRFTGCGADDDYFKCELRVPGTPTPCESFENPDAVEPVSVWFETGALDSKVPVEEFSDERVAAVLLAMPC